METFQSQLEQTTLTDKMRAFFEQVRKDPESWWVNDTEARQEGATIDAQLKQPTLTHEARKLICEWLRAQKDRAPGRGTDETLVIEARVNGFVAHRSLHRARRKYGDVPLIGVHRLLAGQATRQGLGKPLISGLYPIDLWRKCNKPVQHILLNAAQTAGAEHCRPIYPNHPLEKEMRHLVSNAISAETSWKHGLDPTEQESTFNTDNFDAALRKLGLRSAVRQLANPQTIQDRISRHQRAFDWADTLEEYKSAIYDYSIEQSLHLQDTLELYPLHKRVLELIEKIIIPRLRSRGLTGVPSSLWAAAFTGPSKLCAPMLPPRADWWGTLEVLGNWLLIANSHGGRTAFVNLAVLLDGILSQMSTASEVSGVSVTFSPMTTSAHAKQLADLADKQNDKAACMTFYLGKIALQLRNAIEHGIDRVESTDLIVDCPGTWAGNPGPSVARLVQEAGQIPQWHCESQIRGFRQEPPAAKALLLTRASLKRCLVLLSLVLKAGFSHLQLS